MRNEENEIRWTLEDEETLQRLENARDRAKDAGRYFNGDYETIQELKQKRRESRKQEKQI